eukprot:m.74828 g.74828  ORF g.74828 m.74828 type:complete len:493 (+) comp24701_c0_seq3:217-1695(+)
MNTSTDTMATSTSETQKHTLEALFAQALRQVCPTHTSLAKGTFKRQDGERTPEFYCEIASKLFWNLHKTQRPVDTKFVKVTSDFGIERMFTRRDIAEAIINSLEPGMVEKVMAYVAVGPGSAGTIIITTLECTLRRGVTGLVLCSLCGRFVQSHSQGMEWHMKNAHATSDHAVAFKAASQATHALVLRTTMASNMKRTSDMASAPDHHEQPGSIRLQRSNDMTAAQKDPNVLKQMIREGRVQALTQGLDACRSGDTAMVKEMLQTSWNPQLERDRHGSGPLLWAAGGGHLECCKLLVEVGGVNPRDTQHHRRGYDGRSALHWAARNGRLEVVMWLVEDQRCNVDSPAADGTTPFHLAVWQSQLETCRYLLDAGADAHVRNNYGCNSALWASQGPAANTHVFEFLRGLGVDFHHINDNGQGCLHKAAQRGSFLVCRWLLQVANICDEKQFRPNNVEKSAPSDLARYNGSTELSDWLKEQETQFLTRPTCSSNQ